MRLASRKPALLTIGILTAVTTQTEHVVANLGAVVVSSVADVGLQADGRYHVTLNGTFENPSDIRTTVLCDGVQWPSEIHSATTSTLDVSVAMHRTGPKCTFLAHRITDGADSTPSLFLSAAGQDQIRSMIDRGLTGTRHGMEFYGTFPNWQTLDVSVACTQGGDVNPTTEPYDPGVIIAGRSIGQLNITFNEIPGHGVRCSFTPINSSSIATGSLWGPTTLSPYDLYAGTAGIGFYHGNATAAVGADAEDSLASGQRWLGRAGFDVTKIKLSPDMRIANSPGRNDFNPYHINLDVFDNECPMLPVGQNPDGASSPPFLPCAVRSTMYQKILSAPYLHTIVITAYDSATTGDDGVKSPLERRLNPTWYQIAGNTEKVIAEYRELAIALYETQHDTGKRFIISNWETDSELNGCLLPTCNVNVEVEGFKRWFAARKSGISQARSIAQARGLGGVFVHDAIEFNTAPAWATTVPKAIETIIPHVMPEYMAYSAWGGTAGNRGGKLEQDIYDVRHLFPGNSPQLYLGEMGEPFAVTGASWDNFEGLNHGWILAAHTRAAQRAELPATILWTAFDDVSGQAYPPNLHFFNSNGSERSIVGRIRAQLNAGVQDLAVTPRIGGIRVSTVSDGGLVRDYFEMYTDPEYGPFPNTVGQTVVRCSYTCGGAGAACTSPTFDQVEPLLGYWPGSNQSNIAIRHRDPYIFQGRVQERWCTVAIPGMRMFGPKRVSPTPDVQ